MARRYAVESEIIGRRIAGIHYLNLPLKDHYQERDIIVSMDSGTSFNLMQRDCYEQEMLYLSKVSLVPEMKPILQNLDHASITGFPVEEIVASEWWVSPIGLLLTNGYLISVGASLCELGIDIERNSPAEFLRTLVRRGLPKE